MARLNGVVLERPPIRGGFAILERTWQDGDTIELRLPMPLRGLERPAGALGIARGPLILALQVGEEWTRLPDSTGLGDWEVRPTSAWNYALAANPDREPERCEVERATGATREAGMVEEDARTIDDAGVRTLRVGEDAVLTSLRVMFEQLGPDGVGQCRHHHRLIDPVELRAERAAAVAEV